MKVYIANFGQANYLWPACLRRSTVATINNVEVHPYWEAGDRDGFIEHAMKHLKTARGEAPIKPVASRWFSLNSEIANTAGDIWIHREKDELWWTTSLSEPVQIDLQPSFTPDRDGPQIYELHKACEPWSDRTRTGARLSWNGLHPKAKDFLFTEGTLQRLSSDNAEYALALINGEDLSRWHNLPAWKGKSERSNRSAVVSYDARRKSVWEMADTVFNTVRGANGQEVIRTVKEKRCGLSRPDLEAYIDELIEQQEGICVLTDLPLQFRGAHDDDQMLASLDRIDSSGHYERGNLQVVCRFANRWKSDRTDDEFRRLISKVREFEGPR